MPLSIKQPWDLPELDLSVYGYKFLAEGDSWFSIGEMPPWATSNLLYGMTDGFAQRNLVINCARQGDTLSHMHQMWWDANFTRLLDAPKLNYWWDALLLSAGGNDMIDACLVSPDVPDPHQRLLLRKDEIGPDALPEDFVSAGGWRALAGYLRTHFSELVRRRDRGLNPDAALFLHTYSRVTVRNAPAGGAPFPRVGPWLYRALALYQVPQELQQALADALFQRLAALLLSLADPAQRVFVFDSQDPALGLVPALSGSTGPSGDFENEIHLTAKGYVKLGKAFASFIEARL
jgi:lysophospholipase L1-like esterase